MRLEISLNPGQTLGSLTERQWQYLKQARGDWACFKVILTELGLGHWKVLGNWFSDADRVTECVIDSLSELSQTRTLSAVLESCLYAYVEYSEGYLEFLAQSGVTRRPAEVRAVLFAGVESGLYTSIMGGLVALINGNADIQINSSLCPSYDPTCLYCEGGRRHYLLGVTFKEESN